MRSSVLSVVFVNIMSIFGKIGVETPAFTLLKQYPNYEIRQYAPTIRAEVEYAGSDVTNSTGFRDLAGFIFGDNKQRKSPAAEKIAMTAPVLTTQAESEKIAMTAPVLTTQGESEKIAMTSPVVTSAESGTVKMAFILPSKYTSLDQLPTPNNPRVKLTEVPGATYAVHQFSGSTSSNTVDEKTLQLREWLKNDGVKVSGNGQATLARYNPPWTLPFLRTNEIMIPVQWQS
jgi:hypothetical protein